VRVTRGLLKKTRHATCQSVIEHYQQHIAAEKDSAAVAARTMLVETEATFRALFSKVSSFDLRLQQLAAARYADAERVVRLERANALLTAQLGDRRAQEAFFLQCKEAAEGLRGLLREGAEEIRQRITETKLLQPQFIATVERTVGKAVQYTETLVRSHVVSGGASPTQSAATRLGEGRPSSLNNLLLGSPALLADSITPRDGDGSPPLSALSPSALLSSPSSLLSPSSAQHSLTLRTADSLVQQLRNLCTLLRTNYAQQEDIVDRYGSIVSDWEERIVTKLVAEVQSHAQRVVNASSSSSSSSPRGRGAGGVGGDFVAMAGTASSRGNRQTPYEGAREASVPPPSRYSSPPRQPYRSPGDRLSGAAADFGVGGGGEEGVGTRAPSPISAATLRRAGGGESELPSPLSSSSRTYFQYK